MSETGVLEPQKTAKRRKITPVDVNLLTEHVANGNTEKEACAMLGIKLDTWYQWKGRHANQTRFEEILARIQGEVVRNNLGVLDKAASSVNEKTGIPEWRAAEARLKLTMPSRFAAPPSQVNVNLLVNGAPNDLVEAARQSFLRRSTPSNCGVSAPISLPETTITSVQSGEQQHNAQPVEGEPPKRD